ncbi:hypothetical protein F4780DRAFT_474852 [Xylariomycetidae sp. FL0641]|nr:hypothetical protein F4780DRAFT_474852 [Xylariomycetidae sp. FL0641]
MSAPQFDYVIAGGGTAGLVLATRLSEDPSVRVLVIEAGEDLTADPRVNVPAFWPTLLSTPANWDFRTVPQKGLNGRSLKFPQGRLLGGSSALNGLAFSPSSKAHADAIAALGNPGWEWSSFVKSLEKSYNLSGSERGTGPLKLMVPEDETGWPKVWHETFAALGYPTKEDPFSGEFYGSLTVSDAVDPSTMTRSFSGNAYLGTARSRDNLVIWTNTSVDKILLEKANGTVTANGVQVTRDGETKTVVAKREVLVTSGSINSPRLLELSGIGSAERLEPLGIETLIDNPHVGENLQNHPIASVQVAVHDAPGFETMDMIARQDPVATAAAMDAYSHRRGPFCSSGTNSAAQLPLPGIDGEQGKTELQHILNLVEGDSDPGPATREFAKAHARFVRSVLASPTEASGHYLTFPGYAGVGQDGSMAAPPAGTESYFTVAVVLSHPLSRGSVHITTTRRDPASAPGGGVAVDPNYFSHPADLEVMARHLRFLRRRLLATEPLASRLRKRVEGSGDPAPVAGFPGAAADEAGSSWLRGAAVGAHHYTGSCSMMPRELGGVVDARLRVHGCENLRVCDASVMPFTPRTNPQAVVYGIAEHAASIIKGEI